MSRIPFPRNPLSRGVLTILGLALAGGLVTHSAGGAGPVWALPGPTIDDEMAAVDDESGLERLEFKFEKPRTVIVYPGGEGQAAGRLSAGRIYWYLRYTVTYKGTDNARFFVTLLARSDKGRRYSDLALPHVEKKIEDVEQRKLFSKADQMAERDSQDSYVTYTPGEVRECVAIFNPLDPEADKIVIDVHGLVNDLKLEPLGEGRFKIEERVLRLTYSRPGDEVQRSLDRISFEGKKWVQIVRETPPAAG